MSQTVVLSTLSALVDDATLAALQTISSSENNGHRSTRESAYNSMLAGLKDAESSWAGAAAPEVVTGKPWYDTVNGLLKVRRAASWDTILDAATAYGVDIATAGTATFRLAGGLGDAGTALVQTGQVSLGAVTSGTLQTLTMRGSALGRDKSFLLVEAWGGKTGTNAAFSLQWRIGGTGIGTAINFTLTSAMTWHMYLLLVRTGSATQKAGFYAIPSRDDTGSTTLCGIDSSLTKTMSSDLAIDIQCTTKSASDTVTGDLMAPMLFN